MCPFLIDPFPSFEGITEGRELLFHIPLNVLLQRSHLYKKLFKHAHSD
jgi:hypothetical protein